MCLQTMRLGCGDHSIRRYIGDLEGRRFGLVKILGGELNANKSPTLRAYRTIAIRGVECSSIVGLSGIHGRSHNGGHTRHVGRIDAHAFRRQLGIGSIRTNHAGTGADLKGKPKTTDAACSGRNDYLMVQ